MVGISVGALNRGTEAMGADKVVLIALMVWPRFVDKAPENDLDNNSALPVGKFELPKLDDVEVFLARLAGFCPLAGELWPAEVSGGVVQNGLTSKAVAVGVAAVEALCERYELTVLPGAGEAVCTSFGSNLAFVTTC